MTSGTTTRLVTGTGGPLTVAFDLPATVPATHTFAVSTLSGTATATTAVAAPASPASPSVGDLVVSRVEKVGRNNTVRVRVDCAGAVACAGTVKLRTAAKVERRNGSRARLVLAKATYAVEPGRTAKVRLVLTKPARKVVGTKRLRVVATQTARGADPVRTPLWVKRR